MNQLDALIQPDRGQKAIPLHIVDKANLPAWLAALSAGQRAALAGQSFEGGAGETAIVPDRDAWFAVGGAADAAKLGTWCLAPLADRLPAGAYRLAMGAGAEGAALFGWITAQYRFDRYRTDPASTGPRVLLTSAVKAIEPALAEATAVKE